jgi:hypothetical protein
MGLEDPVCARKVLDVYVGEAYVVRLHVAGKIIRTTAEHPFWVAGVGWIAAGELKPGQLLSSHDGNWLPVEAVTFTGECVPVYNVRVEEDHTYFVGCDEWGFSVWAHNACIYRAGTLGQKNLTPRPVDTGGLSTFDSVANLMAAAAAAGHPVAPGTNIQVFDTDKLNAAGLLTISDPPPAGHVSVRPLADAALTAWIASRDQTPESPLTTAMRAAWVRTEKAP